MKNLVMKNHGKIRRGLGSDTEYCVLENEDGEFFLVKNPEVFEQATSGQQFLQKIHRVIHKTAFLTKNTSELYAYTAEEKNTLSILNKKFDTLFNDEGNDEKLIGIVKMCEGADDSDVEKFMWVSEVIQYSDLELGNLSYGLGFPGNGYGLIVCKAYHPYEKTTVYMQKVDSYTEGYVINHYEILPQMIAAIKAGLITEKHFVK
jgi:hypothetical protein